MNFYHSNKYLDLSKNLFQKILIQNCKKFPIPVINEKGGDDKIIEHVDNLIHLNKDLHTATLTTQREQIQRAIDHAERKIDELVYELYGLSEEEVKIVEGV